MNILVTGVTGSVGSRLAPRLRREGHVLRGLTRNPATAWLDSTLDVDLIEGDAITGRGIDQALEGIDVAYYLIHSMESSTNGSFDALERQSAENFARAARAAGVDRIVYLGGLVPSGGPVSRHLASRLAVEQILLRAVPDSVAFRASIVIGAQSRSFRLLVRLVERMPVLAVPAWSTHTTAPIDERDVIELLARAASCDTVGGDSLDIAGPDVVSYGELIDRIRHHMLVGRPTLSLKHLTLTPIASRLTAMIAGEDHALVGPLMESLDEDLLPRDNRGPALLGVRMHTLDAAIEHALRDWEATEELAAR